MYPAYFCQRIMVPLFIRPRAISNLSYPVSHFSKIQKRTLVIRYPLRQNERLTRPNDFKLRPDISQQQETITKMLKRGQKSRLHENKNFHEGDGLKLNEWTLIYKNSGTSYLFLMVMVYSMVSVVVMAVGVQEISDRRKQLRATNQPETIMNIVARRAALFITFAVGVFVTLIRYRRCWVIRLYEKNSSKTGKPPPPIAVSADGPPLKAQPPVREYCIVWVNWLWRRRLYFYKSDEAFKSTESPPLVANIWGNFVARNRRFAVFQHNFEDSLDYYRVRGKNVVGRMFVA